MSAGVAHEAGDFKSTAIDTLIIIAEAAIRPR
jgi:hypothetical protein